MQIKLMNIPYNNFKTQRCKYFDETGVCKFSKNCSFAHGEDELRNPFDQLMIPPAMFPGMPEAGAPGYDMMAAHTYQEQVKITNPENEPKLLVNCGSEQERA